MHSIIKRQNVRVEETAPLPARRGELRAACKKSVRLLELEGRVHALELTCSCGELSLVEFDYPKAETKQETS